MPVLTRHVPAIDAPSLLTSVTITAARRHNPAQRRQPKAAWRVFLSNPTEADFQEWRRQRD